MIRVTTILILSLTLTCLTACGPADPGSNAPDLAGSWTIQGGGVVDGCWTFDSTGDPVSFMANNDTLGIGVTTFSLNGMPQTLSVAGFSATLLSTGQANQTGSDVVVNINLTVSAFIPLANAELNWNATLNGDSLAGQATFSGSTPNGDLPPTASDITGTRDGC